MHNFDVNTIEAQRFIALEYVISSAYMGHGIHAFISWMLFVLPHTTIVILYSFKVRLSTILESMSQMFGNYNNLKLLSIAAIW